MRTLSFVECDGCCGTASHDSFSKRFKFKAPKPCARPHFLQSFLPFSWPRSDGLNFRVVILKLRVPLALRDRAVVLRILSPLQCPTFLIQFSDPKCGTDGVISARIQRLLASCQTLTPALCAAAGLLLPDQRDHL